MFFRIRIVKVNVLKIKKKINIRILILHFNYETINPNELNDLQALIG